MVAEKTSPDIIQALSTALRVCHKGKHALEQDKLPFQGFNEVMNYQNRIGWKEMLEGCIGYGWVHAQNKYYMWIESRKLETNGPSR